jgi:ribA/ribD-fused uncharacterized protein
MDGPIIEAIYFYSKTSGYYELSNFSPHGFQLDGVYWPTVEHYFQAQKLPAQPSYQQRIRRARSPKGAKALGRSRKVPLRPDWDNVKDDLMRQALRAKLFAHPELAALLLETGERVLIENAPSDYYWGLWAYRHRPEPAGLPLDGTAGRDEGRYRKKFVARPGDGQGSLISHPSPGPTDHPRRQRRRDNATSTACLSPPTVVQIVETAPPGPRLNVTTTPPVSTTPQSTDGCDCITCRTTCGMSNPSASAAVKRSTPAKVHSQAMPGKSPSSAARTSSVSPSTPRSAL